MKAGPVLMLAAAALFGIMATVNLFSDDGGANRPKEKENFVGYVVGAYLPSVVLTIAGLHLMRGNRK